MYTLKLALVAFGATLAAAQTGGLCSQPTITINSAADATNIPCKTVNSVLINEGVTGQIDIEGPAQIQGDLIVNNVTQLVSLTSTSVNAIGGTFTLQGLTLLSTLSFTSLTQVNEISWITLPALSSLTFGTVGVTKVNTIRVSDTFLSSLDGLNVASVDSFSIDNNFQLTTYTSGLQTVSTLLSITANGPNLTINAPDLVWVTELEVQKVGSISLPALQTVNASMKFDQNSFSTFTAPNMTSTGKDFSFINNPSLTNISMPAMTKTGGAFTIQNNTALTTINGFPKLAQVGGAVVLRGNMTDIELPALDDVKGAFTVISTGDITNSCNAFSPKRPNGGNGHFQGTYTCQSGVATANEGGNSTSGGSGNSTGGGSFAAHYQVSMPVVLGFAAIGAVAQAM